MKNVLMVTLFFTIIKVGLCQNQIDYFNMHSQIPESYEFHRMSHFTTNLYDGSVNVNIPLFNIELQRLKVPISLFYDTKGIKVKSIASRVGQNWVLNAGGKISRQKRGLTCDFFFEDDPYNGTEIRGWQTHSETWDNNQNVQYDQKPDIFHLTAPGLSTTFMITKGNNAHVISGDNIKIIVDDGDIEGPEWTSLLKWDINSIIVYSEENGNKYVFDIKEWNINQSPPFYSVEVQNWHLSRIVTSKLDTIDFKYIKSDYDILKITRADNQVTSTNIDCHTLGFNNSNWTNHSYAQLNSRYKISDIIFPTGKIEFDYNIPRTDILGDSCLSTINITNTEGQLKKRMEFEYDYFQFNNSNTRLKLEKILFKNVINGSIENFYSFQYSPGEIPDYQSYEYDFMGFYNGRGASDATSKVYALLLGGGVAGVIYIPFIEDDWICPACNPAERITFDGGERKPSFDHTKIGMLSKIKYPSGGFQEFYYELNETEIPHVARNADFPGLRVKKQILKNGSEEYVKTFEYETTELIMPVLGLNSKHESQYTGNSFEDKKQFIEENTVRFNQSPLNIDFYNGGSVAYPVVKEITEGVGYKTYIFDSCEDEDPELFLHNNQSHNYCSLWVMGLSLLDGFNRFGKFPFFEGKSNKHRRGNLKEVWYANENGTYIKGEFYEYDFKEYFDNPLYSYQEKELLESFSNTKTFIRAIQPHHKGKNVQTKMYKVFFNNSNNIMDYYDWNDVAKPIIDLIDNGNTNIMNNIKILEKKMLYYNSNILLSRIDEINSKNETLSTNINYFNFAGNKIKGFIHENYTQNGNSYINGKRYDYSQNGLAINKTIEETILQDKNMLNYEEVLTYDLYDDYNNLLQYNDVFSDKDNCMIWGYNHNLPIAKIENATYQQVTTALSGAGYSPDNLQTKTDSQLITIFNQLRQQLPNAMITSYTHDPLIGVTSITDPRGQTQHFEYDGMNRLIRIKDHEDKIVEEYEYHYVNQ